MSPSEAPGAAENFKHPRTPAKTHFSQLQKTCPLPGRRETLSRVPHAQCLLLQQQLWALCRHGPGSRCHRGAFKRQLTWTTSSFSHHTPDLHIPTKLFFPWHFRAQMPLLNKLMQNVGVLECSLRHKRGLWGDSTNSLVLYIHCGRRRFSSSDHPAGKPGGVYPAAET